MDEFGWIEEESKINEIQNFAISPEPMSFVKVHYVYINMNLEIEDCVIQTVDLDISGTAESILTKERLLYLIQNHKIYTPTTKYKFMSALVYNIDILPTHLQQYIREDLEHGKRSPFLKEINIIDDIKFSASLNLFHSINSMYLFFKEGVLKSGAGLANSGKTAKLKPILKPAVEEEVPTKPNTLSKTKRVRIQENLSVHKTKKNRDAL